MIVIINPNSTVSMTDEMVRTGRNIYPDVEMQGWTSHDGPPAIQGPEDGKTCIPPMLKLVEKASGLGAKSIIIGCFDDTGLNEARAIANCQVIGVALSFRWSRRLRYLFLFYRIISGPMV